MVQHIHLTELDKSKPTNLDMKIGKKKSNNDQIELQVMSKNISYPS